MILCLGTTPAVARTMVFDRVVTGEVNRAASVVASAAGKAVNAARTLRTLDEDVLAMGFLGGETGQFLKRDLDHIGVRSDFVPVSPATRACVTVIDRSANTATELVEEAAPVEQIAWQNLLNKLQSHLPGAKALLLAGTIVPGGPADFYARCAELATTAGVPAIVDAKGEPLALAVAKRPMVVKPNRSELAATVGMTIVSDGDLRAAIRRLVSQGAQWAVVTAGAEATTISDGNDFWQIASPKVKVVSPIGSGDAFAAGLAAGISRGQAVPDACVLGVACAAANAMNMPAGHGRRSDIDSLLCSIRVERV